MNHGTILNADVLLNSRIHSVILWAFAKAVEKHLDVNGTEISGENAALQKELLNGTEGFRSALR